MTAPFPHSHGVEDIRFDPSGLKVATASYDNTARVWDAESGRPLTPPLQHHGDVLRATFSDDGRLLAPCGDETARVWDASTGDAITPPILHASWARRVDLNADGSRLVTVSMDGRVRVFSLSWMKEETATLETIGQLLSGRQTSSSGTEQISADQFRTLWREQWSQFAVRMKTNETHVRQWHMLQRELASFHGQWSGIDFHCGELLKLTDKSKHATLHLRRANALAELGRWNEVVKEYQAVGPTDKLPSRFVRRLGLAYLMANEIDNFNKLCIGVMKPSGGKKRNMADVEVLSRMIAFGKSKPEVIQPMQLLITRIKNRSVVYWILVRSNQAKIARDSLYKAIEKGYRPRVEDLACLALAHHLLGEKKKAKQLLKQASDFVDKHLRHAVSPQRLDFRPWHMRLETVMLIDEVKSKIEP